MATGAGFCQDSAVASSPPARDVSALVETMFANVFTADERAALLDRIHEWERRNPEVDSAHRITGWIDVAYAYQSHLNRADESRPTATGSTPAPPWALRQA
jgi:hypothetical protein